MALDEGQHHRGLSALLHRAHPLLDLQLQGVDGLERGKGGGRGKRLNDAHNITTGETE